VCVLSLLSFIKKKILSKKMAPEPLSLSLSLSLSTLVYYEPARRRMRVDLSLSLCRQNSRTTLFGLGFRV